MNNILMMITESRTKNSPTLKYCNTQGWSSAFYIIIKERNTKGNNGWCTKSNKKFGQNEYVKKAGKYIVHGYRPIIGIIDIGIGWSVFWENWYR